MRHTHSQFRDILWTCLSILTGNAVMAFAIAAFVMPHDIITGGATGVGILLSHFFPTDVATNVLVLNVLALLLGLAVLGKKFFVATVSSSLLYPAFLGIMPQIPGIAFFSGDEMLSAVFAGGLIGAALGMVIRVGASTGGMDVVNLVLHKWFHLPVSVFVYLVDIVILSGQALFTVPEKVLYGIVLLVVETLVLNEVMLLGQSQIQVFVISRRFELIRQKILVELQAGATMVMIETGCREEAQKGVLCVIPPRKLFSAKELIRSVDPEAFITVTQIKEVRGQGFTSERKAAKLKYDEATSSLT